MKLLTWLSVSAMECRASDSMALRERSECGRMQRVSHLTIKDCGRESWRKSDHDGSTMTVVRILIDDKRTQADDGSTGNWAKR